ncbi:MAG TPA: FtsX-like permease family protein [Candidatus Acidoferrales bacterium]|jgi:putative ABC transport system permease protein|nr:FtsX-like permease family protein [Candidatus Acidoferrales bacterium]
MFWRLLWKLLRGSSGRLVVAILALVSGAMVISALLNLEFDIERKLTQEFRMLGANLVISPGHDAQITGAAPSALMNESDAFATIQNLRDPAVEAAVPFLYIVERAEDTPVVVAGTKLEDLPKLEPSWRIEGQWTSSRDDQIPCVVGRNVAQQLHLALNSPLHLSYVGKTAQLTLVGIVDAGGAEDNQVFLQLPEVQSFAGLPGQIGLVQLSVRGTAKSISDYAARLATALPANEVRPIRQVTEAEGDLLNRIRLLIVSMVLLILVLTALCVLATMAALAMERRQDVGLMKALGGSIARIVALFMAEVGVLGATGGFVGTILGIELSRWMGQRVFGTAISVRWEIFPLTIALMAAVALAGALPLRLLGKVKPAVIFRGE